MCRRECPPWDSARRRDARNESYELKRGGRVVEVSTAGPILVRSAHRRFVRDAPVAPRVPCARNLPTSHDYR